MHGKALDLPFSRLFLFYLFSFALSVDQMNEGTSHSAASCSSGTSKKTVYLIRHAESEENRRLFSMKTAVNDVARFSMPKASDVSAAMSWFYIPAQVDSAVSEKGKQQIAEMAELLKKEKFLERIQLVAHSPLQRARDTSKGVLGCEAPDILVEPVQRVVDLDILEELTLLEWTVTRSSFIQRLAKLEEWLQAQPEESIVLVGHSQFFKALLNLGFKFRNCDVWRVNFDAQRTSRDDRDTSSKYNLPAKWTNLTKLYSCETENSVDSQ